MSAPDPNDHGILGERLKRAADAAAPRPVDVDEVLRRSRAARRTRRTALVSGVGAVAGVLAVTGLVLGLPGLLGPTATDGQVALESAESSGLAPEAAEGGGADDATGSRLVAPYDVNQCGAPVAPATDAAASPLTVTATPPAGPVPPGGSATVSVTVTNTGDESISGTLDPSAAVTVANGGITAWHSGPGDDARTPAPISLAPGATISLEAAFDARACTAAQETGAPLPSELPALEAGDYGVGVIVAFTDVGGHGPVYLISPLAPFTVG